MRKRIKPGIKASLVRGPFYLLLLPVVCAIPFALAQRTPTKGNRPVNTITVTNTNDSGPGSLRQALADANDGDTINFAATGSIGLTSGELVVNKSVTISGPGADSLTIDGNSQSRVLHIGSGKTVTISGLTITHGNPPNDDGGGVYDDHATLEINGCTISNNVGIGGAVSNHHGTLTMNTCTVSSNYTGDRGGGILNEEGTLSLNNCVIGPNNAYSGSGIYNSGSDAVLTIINSSISMNFNNGGGEGGGIYNESGMVAITNSAVNENTASLLGDPSAGGIFNGGTIEIINSTLNGNFAGDIGGGILNSGTLTVTNSTISGNHAGTNLPGGGRGAGIYNYGTATITNSSIIQNDAGGKEPSGWGAGIGSEGSMEISNSTISGNGADQEGGGIYNFGPLHITNCTISGNSANENAGGIYNGATGIVELENTILNEGDLGANIFNNGGAVTSHGYNISSDDAGGLLTGPGDQINTDPMVGSLQDNSGPTLTHALLPGSPAINAGDPSFTPPPVNDQRGAPFVRVFSGRIDIGSFEVQPTPRPTPTPRVRPTPRPRR
jgi:hypothetical protein